MSERGKFIVIYGPNNTGKSVQAKLLVERLKSEGLNARYQKWPIYDLEPTGPELDRILRYGGKSTPLNTQKLFAQNRKDFEPKLINILEQSYWVVGEDYLGTGIAWGMTFGIKRSVLEEINKELLIPDLSLCFIGERFLSGVEKGHLHEDSGLWEKNRKIHERLAKLYGWKIIQSDKEIEQVSNNVRNVVQTNLL